MLSSKRKPSREESREIAKRLNEAFRSIDQVRKDYPFIEMNYTCLVTAHPPGQDYPFQYDVSYVTREDHPTAVRLKSDADAGMYYEYNRFRGLIESIDHGGYTYATCVSKEGLEGDVDGLTEGKAYLVISYNIFGDSLLLLVEDDGGAMVSVDADQFSLHEIAKDN